MLILFLKNKNFFFFFFFQLAHVLSWVKTYAHAMFQRNMFMEPGRLYKQIAEGEVRVALKSLQL